MTTRSVRENGLRVAANIRLLRLTRGLTALDLSQLLQVSPSSVSESERGIRRINVDDLYDYAKALNVPVASLLIDEWAVTGTTPRPTQARVLCSCAFLPDPHIWGASCPPVGDLVRTEQMKNERYEDCYCGDPTQPNPHPGKPSHRLFVPKGGEPLCFCTTSPHAKHQAPSDAPCTCKGMGEHVRGTGLCLWVGVAEGPGQL